MARVDIFNGDADGICALTQLRNAEPGETRLVTGVKRDISLVAKAGIEAGDRVTILDISLDKNREGLEAALALGADVIYFDHHFAGDIPASANLTAHIDSEPDVCTSILVNRYLEDAFIEWAVVGAFGDNLKASAEALVAPLGLSAEQVEEMENLGVYINYNGYGASLEDLHFAPAELFEQVSPFSSPFDFMAEKRESFEKLDSGYHEDMTNARALQPLRASDASAVYMFPDESWARRASGVFSNELANGAPARAHAVITERSDASYLVSVRAPLENKVGADELCRRFPTGGGRKAAAGINNLPQDQLDEFIDAFATFYS